MDQLVGGVGSNAVAGCGEYCSDPDDDLRRISGSVLPLDRRTGLESATNKFERIDMCTIIPVERFLDIVTVGAPRLSESERS